MADISSRVKLFLHKKNHIILLTPAIILLLLLSIYPLIYSLNLSFSRWQLGTSPDTSEYVGFTNYIWLFNTDAESYTSFQEIHDSLINIRRKLNERIYRFTKHLKRSSRRISGQRLPAG